MPDLYTMAEFTSSGFASQYAGFHYPDLLDGDYTGYCVAGHWSQRAILHLLVQLHDTGEQLDLCFFPDSYHHYCFKDQPEAFVEQNVRITLVKSSSGRVYCRNIEVI